MGKEAYKPTPEDEKTGQAMLTPDTAFKSEVRSEALTGDRVALDHERTVVFEGGKIFLEEDSEIGRKGKQRVEQSPREAIEGLENEEKQINNNIEELQQQLDEIATLKKRILGMQADQVK